MTDPVSEGQLWSVTRRVIDQLTYAGHMFTALDVSNAVKQTLSSVRHRQVSPLVREMFDEGAMGEDYERTTIEVYAGGRKANRTTAFLYHLEELDPEDYTNRDQVALAPVSAAVGDDTTLDGSVDELSLQPGQDGRLRIPRQLLERAGVDTDQVQVDQIAPGKLALSALPFGQVPGGLGLLVYVHPSHLHVGRRYLKHFDSSQPVTAIADASQGCLRLEGAPPAAG